MSHNFVIDDIDIFNSQESSNINNSIEDNEIINDTVKRNYHKYISK